MVKDYLTFPVFRNITKDFLTISTVWLKLYRLETLPPPIQMNHYKYECMDLYLLLASQEKKMKSKLGLS